MICGAGKLCTVGTAVTVGVAAVGASCVESVASDPVSGDRPAGSGNGMIDGGLGRGDAVVVGGGAVGMIRPGIGFSGGTGTPPEVGARVTVGEVAAGGVRIGNMGLGESVPPAPPAGSDGGVPARVVGADETNGPVANFEIAGLEVTMRDVGIAPRAVTESMLYGTTPVLSSAWMYSRTRRRAS